MLRMRLIAVAIVTTMVSLVGCGFDGEPEPTATETKVVVSPGPTVFVTPSPEQATDPPDDDPDESLEDEGRLEVPEDGVYLTGGIVVRSSLRDKACDGSTCDSDLVIEVDENDWGISAVHLSGKGLAQKFNGFVKVELLVPKTYFDPSTYNAGEFDYLLDKEDRRVKASSDLAWLNTNEQVVIRNLSAEKVSLNLYEQAAHERSDGSIKVGTGRVVFVNYAYSEEDDACVAEDVVFDVLKKTANEVHGVQFYDANVNDDDRIGQDVYIGMQIRIVIPKGDYHPITLERGDEPFSTDESDGCNDRGSIPEHLYDQLFTKVYYNAASWNPSNG